MWEPGAIEWDDQLLAVFNVPEGTPYVRSEASRILIEELRRYAVPRTPDSAFRKLEESRDGVITGRSVLISGQRGSGKTATVLWAVREVQVELLRSGTLVRLLPIPVTASAFLDGVSNDSTAKTGELDANSTEQESSLDDLTPAERLLFAICCAMHRTVIAEFLRSLRSRVAEIAGEHTDAQSRELELFELLAQLEHDIEDFVPLRQLRAIWQHMQFLNPDGSGTALFRRKVSGQHIGRKAALPPGQAAAEMSLLATLNELYLRLVGTIFRDGVNELEQNQTNESFLDKPEWRQMLGSLLTGGLSGATAGGLLHFNPFATALAGLLGTVGGAVILPMLGRWSQSDKFTRRIKYSRDYSRKTLALEVPRLIDSLKNAGLFPVFIVDELDKYESLKTMLDPTLRHLKHFFGDRAMFCFLTHRQFFDELADEKLNRPTGVTTSWFGRNCFVEYSPWEVRRWLRDRLESALPTIPQADRQLWELVLVGRATSNMMRLHHEVEWLEARYRSGAFKFGEVFDVARRSIQVEATFQLVSELVLSDVLGNEHVSNSDGMLHKLQFALSLPRQSLQENSPFRLGAAKEMLQRLVADSVDLTQQTKPFDHNLDWETCDRVIQKMLYYLANDPMTDSRLKVEKYLSELGTRFEGRWSLDNSVRDAMLACLPLGMKGLHDG